MAFWIFSEITLIRYSTMLWVYLGIRLFFCLAFIIGITYFGAKMKRESLPTGTQPQKSKFVSLGIGWIPRKEERRKGMIAERREGKRTAWIASLTLILGIVIGTFIGRTSRDYQLNSSIMHMPDTLITSSVHADGSRDMMAKDGRLFGTKFCIHGDDDPNNNDLIAGNKLKQFDFIQRYNCKEIRGYGVGYIPYSTNGVRDVFQIPEETADAR